MKKRDLIAGTGAVAAALALYTAMDSALAQTAPALEPEQIIAVDAQGTAAVSEAADDGELAPAKSHTKWAIGAALGTLIGGFAAAIGFNRLMNWLAAGRKAAGTAASTAAKATTRAARATGAAAARVLEGPGRFAAKGSIIALGAVIALVLLDVSWKASLAIGAGSLLIGAMGWRKPRPVPVKVHNPSNLQG